MNALATPDNVGTQGLIEGFAQQVERWALAHSPKPEAESVQAAVLAARLVIQGHLAGHVCVPCQSLAQALNLDNPSDLPQLRRRLERSGVVGPAPATSPRQAAASHGKPLIIDAEGRLYLHRNFDHERQLAQRIAALWVRPAQHEVPSSAAMTPQAAPHAVPLSDEQQGAVERAMRRSFTVISGGPGTGKTTTVVQLLVAWQRQSPELRIALAAPTGKAAARMMESIRKQTQGLEPEVLQRLPTSGYTIHRLLGAGPKGYAHHAQRPLALDVLVVDEASMLDLALARALFEALPPNARLVLLGDKDQLAAVEAGSVFADLSAQGPHVEWLTQNFRFGSGTGIAELAEQVRCGDEAAVLAALARFEPRQETWWSRAQSGYANYVEAVRTQPQNPSAALQAFENFRVLCAVREGPRGMNTLNDKLSAALAPQLQAVTGQASRTTASTPSTSPAPAWYLGRPIIIRRNEPRLQLYNGDIGITLPDAQGQLQVWFPNSPGTGPDQDGSMRALRPSQLPSHETAWALTVHRAQGSEFEDLLVLLPEQESRVVTHELIYTAVTRARTRLTLVASTPVLKAGLTTTLQRHSGLMSQVQREVECLLTPCVTSAPA